MELATALSRHIGYTTAAYDLDRIVGVLNIFRSMPSAYLAEIVDQIKSSASERVISDEYIEEIISFASSMRIIATVTRKDARLRRLAPTEHGRSLVGARDCGDSPFHRFSC